MAGFLVSAALLQLASLVQLHFQRATPGELLPGPADLAKVYAASREKPVSHIERLLVSTTAGMHGLGSMRPAFFEESRDWTALVRRKTPEEMPQLLAERSGECLALLSWVRAGAKRDAYEQDDYPLGDDFTTPITEDFLVQDEQTGKPALPKRLRVRTLLEKRCVECHRESGRDGHAQHYPLNTYERLRPYCQVPPLPTISPADLAQATQAQLGFAVLYAATGLAFCFTGYPRSVRMFLGPLPLAALLANFGCCWLARLVPAFAWAIWFTSLAAALGLTLHVAGCLWDLCERGAKAVVAVLGIATVIGGVAAKFLVVDPYLEQERADERQRRIERRSDR